MKKVIKKDFTISTSGLGILQTFMYINIGLIAILVIAGLFYELTVLDNLASAIATIIVGFIIALPSIIVCCLIQMFIDYMYNIEQQSKIQSNLDVTTRKILDALEIMNSYKSE